MKKEEILNQDMNEDIVETEVNEDIDYIESIINNMSRVELNKENLENFKLDDKEFEKGINKVSSVAGMFTCLVNCGMDSEQALTYILNEANIKHAQDMQKIINKNNIEVSKISSISLEGNRI